MHLRHLRYYLFLLATDSVRTRQNQWQTTTEQWQDIVCQRFEREYWSEYTNTIPAALRELDRLAETIERVRKEVP